MNSLNLGIKLAQRFHRVNDKKLSVLLPRSGAGAYSGRDAPRLECKLPEWFYASKAQVGDVIALVLFYSSRPATNGEITKIVAKEWRKVHLQNISKYLTTKGKHLYPYVTKDPKTRAFELNGAGKRWVVTQVVSRLRKTAGTLNMQN